MVVTDPGIDVPNKNRCSEWGDAVDDGLEFFIELRRGAECWRVYAQQVH